MHWRLENKLYLEGKAPSTAKNVRITSESRKQPDAFHNYWQE